jgi:hypothetical protein
MAGAKNITVATKELEGNDGISGGESSLMEIRSF